MGQPRGKKIYGDHFTACLIIFRYLRSHVVRRGLTCQVKGAGSSILEGTRDGSNEAGEDDNDMIPLTRFIWEGGTQIVQFCERVSLLPSRQRQRDREGEEEKHVKCDLFLFGRSHTFRYFQHSAQRLFGKC